MQHPAHPSPRPGRRLEGPDPDPAVRNAHAHAQKAHPPERLSRCARASGQPSLIAFSGRKLHSQRMRRTPPLLSPETGPRFQVIPPLPRNVRPIARPWAGHSRHEARPQAARVAQAARRLAGASGAGARFLLGVGGARAAEAARRLQVSARTCRRCSPARVHERRGRARAPARGGGSGGARLRRLWDGAPPSPHRGRRRPRASLGGTGVPACRTASPTLGAAAEQPAQRSAELGRCGDEAPCGAPSPEPALRGPAARAPEGRPPTRPPPAGCSA